MTRREQASAWIPISHELARQSRQGESVTIYAYPELVNKRDTRLDPAWTRRCTALNFAKTSTNVSVGITRHQSGHFIAARCVQSAYRTSETCINLSEFGESIGDSAQVVNPDVNVGSGRIGFIWMLMLGQSNACAHIWTTNFDSLICKTSAARPESWCELTFSTDSDSLGSVSHFKWGAGASLGRDLGQTTVPSSSPTSDTGPLAIDSSPDLVTVDAGPEQPLTRRQLLQRRMPPREGIQAIIDSVKGKRRPWFDDKYDWEPKD